MSEININKVKATHGKFNLDNGNVVIEVDVELNTKEIDKNIPLKIENLIEVAPELLESAKEVSKIKTTLGGQIAIDKLEKAIQKVEGDMEVKNAT